jgi:hypothetical protein
VLRADVSAVVCGDELDAASTIWIWLRAFTWDHARPLEPAAGQLLARVWPMRGVYRDTSFEDGGDMCGEARVG